MDDPAQKMAETHNYVRMALPLMSKHGVPITPRNYAVWYAYVSGADVDLSVEIDQLIKQGRPFAPETNEQLHRRFFDQGGEGEILELRQELQQVLLTVLQEVTGLSGHTEKYEQTVAASVAQLAQGATAKEIAAIVGRIISETKEMLKFGRTIQQRLYKANVDLKAIRDAFDQVRSEALIDFLTGAPNRKAFDAALTRMMADGAGTGKGLCLLLIDIDHFKHFNDRHGHIVGDEVLKFVAKRIKSLLKGRDVFARYGGEEFVALLPFTDLAGARAAAENIRQYFATAELKAVTTAHKLGVVTVSIGVARLRSAEPAVEFISRADQALYQAKSNGRNRVADELDLTPAA
ncbi:MAG: GGDEF domain-containing protein [Desulfatitalea sp.]|nr:GGDEF domain-containing protein [Desulfatitalea sp.]NNK00916.1 GGDEF domain-containing protein [Desulfatitalea sp.]